MTKRLSSKLLAVILTLAICATTVFGCLMTVSADTSWVTFGAGETTNEELTKATMKLTVNLPASAEGFTATQDGKTYGGIVAGTVALDYDSDLTLTAVKVDGGTKVDNTYAFDADEFVIEYLENDSNKFLFEASNGDNIYYSQLTFELSFTLTGAKNGDKFSVTASSVEIAGALGGTYGPDAVAGTIVAGCDHKLTPVGEPIVTDTVNGYAVYSDSVCTEKCGNHFGPQVVPTKLPGEISVLEFIRDGSVPNVYYDETLADNPEVETGADWDHAIIIDSARELSYLTQYAPTSETRGKYYKVADGIKGFDMSGGSQNLKGIINLDGTLDENFEKITGSGKNHNAPSSNAFAGHFDGNGATVYGLWHNDQIVNGVDQTPKAAGLFSFATGDVTIENVNVALSYLKATQYAGGIVGAYFLDTSFADISKNQLTIEKCSVTDCHIETTTTGNGDWGTKGTGAIYGIARCYSGSFNGSVLVNNCFINLDADHFVSKAVSGEKSLHGGIGGTAVTTNAKFTNCVVIGITPYTTFNAGYQGGDVQHTGPAAKYTNIYTDAVVGSAVDIGFNGVLQDYTKCMTQLTTAQMKGTAALDNMTYLRWKGADDAAWEVDVNRGYPKFIQEETPDLVSDTSDYELTLIGTNITYNNGGDYNYNFYYRPNTTDLGNNYEPKLYVAQLNDKTANTDGATLGSFHCLEGEVLTSSPVDGVKAGDIRYTIKRLSAREIYNTMLATAVVVKDGNVLWGETDDFSIAKYEQAIIDGAEYETADKNLAEAVLKYGKASAAALNTKNDTASGTTIYWDGTTASSLDTFEVKDGVYIINKASELAYIVSAAPDVTKGKTFKVADGISNIVLQKKEHDNGIMQLSGHDKVRDYFEDSKNSKTPWVSTLTRDDGTMAGHPSIAKTVFAGTFDGNGATIYGMYNSNMDGSVFGTTAVGAVIKNLAVRNCYVKSGWYGAIVSGGITRLTSDVGTVTYENIEISGCQIVANGDATANTGVAPYPMDMALLYGHQTGGGANVAINNLLVYDNEMYHLRDNQPHTQLVGSASWNNVATSIKNSVILDCAVSYNTQGKTPFNMSNQVVENVYSSCAEDSVNSRLSIIDREDAMGIGAVTNMDNLDWVGTWCYGSTYPSLAKGAYSTSSSAGRTIYWNGTAASKFYQDTDGASAKNPIIIDTAEKLAYVATAKYADTNGKYFKIADGIDKIVLQSETYGDDIVALDSATAVKNYFEPIIASDISNSKRTLHRWLGHTWNPATMCFAGTFDGNGVEIHGMYNTTSDINSTIIQTYGGNSGGGLFCVAEAATISNVAIMNSYTNIGAMSAGWQFGLIVSYGKDFANDGNAHNVINIDHCTVANNYIYRQDSTNTLNAGIICGKNEYGPVIMQNCLVYGNSATGRNTSTSVEYKIPIIGGGKNSLMATDEYKAAHPEWVNGDGRYESVLENSVVLGAPLLATNTAGTEIVNSTWCVLSAINDANNCFKNVYTDWNVNNITDVGNFKKDYFLKNCGEVVNANDLIGNTAKANEIVGIFNADNGDTVWYTGNSALLGFTPPTEMLPSAQAIYDAITFDVADCDVYNENNKTFGVYATSLNLKTNPYISFAFAFSGKYKSNRDKIKVTFTYNGGSKTVDVADANGALLDGWSNASNDRFHIYRFQDIPVAALSSPITVTVAYNGTEKVTTGTFSVEGFGFEMINAYKKAPGNYYATRIEAVKALLFYTQMLQARYTSTHPVV